MFDFFSPIDAIRRISPQKAGKNIEESYGYLLNDFSSVAKIMGEYYPLELLKLSLWDERKILSEKSRDQVKRHSAVLLPVLLQSVLLSTHFVSAGSERNVSERDWSRLKSLSEDVTRRLIRLIENRTALASSEENFSDEDAVNYRNIIAVYLLPEEMTGERVRRSSSLLRSLLEEKVELEEKTGVDYLTLSLNLDNIARRGLGGIDDLCARVQAYRDDYDLALAKRANQIEGKTEEEVYRIITKANGWEGRAENLARERDGFDMFTLSSLSDLDRSVYSVFTAGPGTLDLISFMKMGYWPSLRFPFFTWKGEEYTFVGKHIPLYIALTSSFNRRRAAMHDVLAIFYRTGIDTYTYDGNSIDISVLPSFYDRNLFTDQKAYESIRKAREDERALKPGYGHRRLIVDPDQREDKESDGSSLVISSAFMAEATVDRTKKRDLLSSLLGDLDLPEEKSEYSVVDEDELDRTEASVDDVADDTVSDEFEYDTVDEDEEAKKLDERDENVEFVEYEKKDSVDIEKEEEKYALTDEIIRKDEEIEKEEEKYESELDDDIFDDTEEEERLDEIGEKAESDYYEEIEEEPVKEETPVETADEDEEEDDGQLDFFSILDEEEEKSLDDELEKEDEEEYREEEQKAEDLEPAAPTLEDEIAEKIEEEELFSDEDEPVGPEEDIDVSDDDDAPETAEENEEVTEAAESEETALSDEEEETETSDVEAEKNDFESESEEVEQNLGDADEEEEDDASLEAAGSETETSDDEDETENSESEPDEEVEQNLEDADEEGEDDVSLETADNEIELSDEEEEIETSDDTEELESEESPDVDEEETENVESEDEEEETESSEEQDTEESFETADDEIALSDEGEEVETSDDDPDDGVEKEEDKPLDVKSWMNDFLGINDIKEEAEAEKESAAAEEPEATEEPKVTEPEVTEPETPEEPETKQEEKPLDVNSWMNDFLGLNDVVPENEEDEKASDEANLDDDGFVLPRMGMIDEEEKKEDIAVKEEEAEAEPEEEETEEKAVSVTLDDEVIPTPVENISEVSPRVFTTSSDNDAAQVNLEESEIPQRGDSVQDEEEETEKQVLSMEELDDADDPVPLMTAEETEEEDTLPFSGIVSDIYKRLAGSGDVFRSFVKEVDEETLEELEGVIHNCWNRMQSEQKDKLFNVPDYSFSLLLAHDSKKDDLRMSELLNNVGGVMYAREKDEWTAVIIYIDSNYTLETAIEKTLTKDSFSPSDWKRVTYIGEQMRKR